MTKDELIERLREALKTVGHSSLCRLEFDPNDGSIFLPCDCFVGDALALTADDEPLPSPPKGDTQDENS